MTSKRPGREQRGQQPDPAGGAPAQAAPAGTPSGPPLLEQVFDAGSMYQLRAAVAAHAGYAGLSRARAEDMVVAVHELAANVVRHGSGSGRLRVWRRDEELHCQITEEADGQPANAQDGEHAWRAANAAEAPDAVTWTGDAAGAPNGPPWRIQHGHGLWLVRQLADSTSLKPGPEGVTATITFSLPPVS